MSRVLFGLDVTLTFRFYCPLIPCGTQVLDRLTAPVPRNSIEISQRQVADIAVIDLAGEIDLYNSGGLKSALNELIAQKQYRIILNMKRVSYIDSTAIGVLVNVLLALKQNKGDLKLAQAEASIRKVMRLTHLDDFLQLCDSEEAAIAAFGKS